MAFKPAKFFLNETLHLEEVIIEQRRLSFCPLYLGLKKNRKFLGVKKPFDIVDEQSIFYVNENFDWVNEARRIAKAIRILLENHEKKPSLFKAARTSREVHRYFRQFVGEDGFDAFAISILIEEVLSGIDERSYQFYKKTPYQIWESRFVSASIFVFQKILEGHLIIKNLKEFFWVGLNSNAKKFNWEQRINGSDFDSKNAQSRLISQISIEPLRMDGTRPGRFKNG